MVLRVNERNADFPKVPKMEALVCVIGPHPGSQQCSVQLREGWWTAVYLLLS